MQSNAFSGNESHKNGAGVGGPSFPFVRVGDKAMSQQQFLAMQQEAQGDGSGVVAGKAIQMHLHNP